MVMILDSDGQILESLFVDRRSDQVWREYAHDLSPYAGREIRLYFGVYNNGSGGATGMYVDDVTLGPCAEPAPVPTATTQAPPPAAPFRAYLPAYLAQPAERPYPGP